ncbi:IS3 family transposase [Actinotignum timonense]|uniref:IS3 family transposase n=1 Tax=Actinotignum timonense TaxID=1870995 RepID=UPI000B34CC51|nr:IS3 family transposase [Actinotignum timonense]
MSKRTYTREQIRKALTTYQRTQSVTATVRKLGYPGRDTLYKWIRNSNEKPEQRKPKKHAPNQKISTDVKVTACKRFRSGENAYTIAQDLGIVNCTNIYAWVKKWDAEGSLGLMNEKECDQIKAKTRHQLEAQLPQDPEELRALVADLIVQKRVLKAQLELAKKGKARTGGRSEAGEKTRVANQLRSTTPLAMVLDTLDLPASSYYYTAKQLERPDKHARLRELIAQIAREGLYTYGYRRIRLALRKLGYVVSEKVIQRLMREEEIPVRYAKARRKYSSYGGEISPAPENLVERDFHADEPGRLWLTDISEFHAANGKVYLSPIIDCYDGKVVAYTRGLHPTSVLADSSLENALATLPHQRLNELQAGQSEHPLVIHSDRGVHYRSVSWIELTRRYGLTRSMSKKGCSPDNSACEGFFGRMKTEIYHGKKWATTDELCEAIDEYMFFYNQKRITLKFDGLTIVEHRQAVLSDNVQ